MDGDGDFVVAWQSPRDGSGNGIFARRFSSAGGGLGAEFQVNAYTSSGQEEPAVGMDSDGDFVVAWESFAQDGNVRGVFARRFNAAGNAVNGEFQVNTYDTGRQGEPAVGGSASRLVVAWESYGQDGNFGGVFAQRFVSSAVLDIDGNGSTDALTDGILVVRFLFGLTGATLVAGAVDNDACTRCGAIAIQAYLGTLI